MATVKLTFLSQTEMDLDRKTMGEQGALSWSDQPGGALIMSLVFTGSF